MEKRLTAVVLKTIDYKENDKLVTLLTKEEGKQTIKMRGVRTSKSKLRYASFPFFYGVYVFNQTKSGFILTGVDPINRYDYSALNLKEYYLSALIVELADKLSAENFVDELLFEFTVKSLEYVNDNKDAASKALDLIKTALEIAGHGLNSSYPEHSNGFSYDEGGLVDTQKTFGMKLTDGMVSALKSLLNGGCVPQKYLPGLLSLLSGYFATKTGKKLLTVEQIIQMQDIL